MAAKKKTKKSGSKPTNPALYNRVKAELKESLMFTQVHMLMLG